MTIDLYTKAILTVIAIALSASVFQNSFSSAIADGGVQKVAICDYNDGTSCARVGGHLNSDRDALAVVDINQR